METTVKTSTETSTAAASEPTELEKKEKKKYFQKFKVRDIVFLAIVSAIGLVTCAVMPLVIPYLTVIFGIAQLVTGLQLSLFYAIGLAKVRKPGSLFIMTIFTGLMQLAMSPPMFFTTMITGIVAELLVGLIFRGYEKNVACWFGAMIVMPLTLPFNYLYNLWFGKKALAAVASRSVGLTIGMTFAVIAVSALGAWLGMKIFKELQKSGALKK